MTKEQALNYLKSSGMSKEQIQAIVKALSSSDDLSSELEKNSKKLEKDFGELDCISRESAQLCLTGENLPENRNEYIALVSKRLRKLPSILPNFIEPVIRDNGVKDELEPTTKNDLVVDAISRADVLKLMKDNWHTHNGDWAMQESMDDIRALPAVTPIRPKGHWIEQIDHEENCRTLICSNCDRPALHDGDSIWKHKFCPYCGADMREVEEE